ncbi:MAG: hypothetical protein E7653_03600 [Ruminococcaceae bacterium]|nr:hypothetical protein [Oscillospiraceae bacterium]
MKSRSVLFSQESRAVVMLGDCLASRVLALRLYVFYGTTCVICDRKRSIFAWLLPFGAFRKIFCENGCAVLLQQLEDIAEEDCEILRFLVVSKRAYSNSPELCMRGLEDRYIITDKKNIVSFLNCK